MTTTATSGPCSSTTTDSRPRADVAYGGAFYATVELTTLGLSVIPSDLPALIAHGLSIKAELNARLDLQLPDDELGNGFVLR